MLNFKKIERISADQLHALLDRARTEQWDELVLLGPQLIGPRFWKDGQKQRYLSYYNSYHLRSDLLQTDGLQTAHQVSEYVDGLSDRLRSLTKLKTLVLWGKDIDDEGVKALVSLINLTSLNLGLNKIGDDGAKAIATLANLTSLDLSGNSIGSIGAESLASLTNLTSLNVSVNNITTLPPEIGNLTTLTSLTMDDNGITTLPPEIGKLSALTELQLRRNKLKTLPPEIGELAALTKLNLSENQVSTLPPEIGNLTTLTSLTMDDNGITTLPPEIGKLSALTELQLRRNKLKTLPPEIGELTALTKLNLSENQVSTLPPEIGNLTTLTSLTMDDNGITTLPPEIGKLSALTELQLRRNKLKTLPPEIGELTALTKLNLSENQVSTLPPEIGNLTTLTKLNLSENQVSTLPPEIGKLSALTELQLRRNKLKTLPPEIGELTALTKLNLSENQVSTLPPEIGKLSALIELQLWRNKLKTLPPEIGELTALTKLNLSENQVSTLPPEIGKLSALIELQLWRNKLKTLPPEIGELTALTKLNLSENQVSTLAPEIGKLTTLTELDLGSNKLKTLPPEIVELNALTKLNVWGNPLTEPPLRIAEQGLSAVKHYFSFKDRSRAGEWVAVGSRLSRHFKMRSVLAALETVAMAVAVFVCAQIGWPQPVWAAALVAPVLLFKTEESISQGIQHFAVLMQRLGLKTTRASATSVPVRLLGLGFGSLAIKMLTTPYYVVRNPAAALKAMPENMRELCFRIDLACAPELIPGLERAYDRNSQYAFIISDLRLDARHPYLYIDKPGEEAHKGCLWSLWIALSILMSNLIILVFFAVATAYRLYVKAAAGLYLPLLLIDLPNRKRLQERTSPSGEIGGGRTKIAIQTAVGGLAFVGLLGLNGQPELQAAVAGWFDEKLLAVWQAAAVSEWMPKSLLSLMLLQSLAYLGGYGSEVIARWARAGSNEKVPSMVAQRWIGLAHRLYETHVFLIAVLLVGIFTAIAPNAILIVEGAWNFLFGPVSAQ